MIGSIGVVVPVRNEEALLGKCLQSLESAARAVPVPVQVVVVLDSCTDTSADVVARSGLTRVTALSVDAGNVGVARAAGMAELLSGRDPGRLWLATTDADGTVPTHWLSRQLEYAADGADVVVGTVQVRDWEQHTSRVITRFSRLYASAGSAGHPHVHGANLGFRASMYVQAGGFAGLGVAEDHALVSACTAQGAVIRRVADLAVTTSARRQGRAAGGFAHLLDRLALESDPV